MTRPESHRGGGVLTAARDVEIRVVAAPETIVTVRTVGGDLALRADFSLDAVDDLKLAVDEACTTLAALARPGTALSCTFSLDEERITVTASVSTLGPTGLPTDTFGWRVLRTLTDDLRVLAEAPDAPGRPHRLALRMSVPRAGAPLW